MKDVRSTCGKRLSQKVQAIQNIEIVDKLVKEYLISPY